MLGVLHRTSYAAAKAALISFRSWALELATSGITCKGLDLIGQLSDLGVCLRASDRSAQQATATRWFC